MDGRIGRIVGFWNEDWSLRLFLWMAILIIFVATPLEASGIVQGLFMRGAALVAFAFGVFTVTRRLVLQLAGVLCISALALLSLVGDGSGHPRAEVAHAFVAAVFAFGFAAMVLRQVVRPGTITWHRIEGAIAVYLMVGLGYSWLYVGLERLFPGSFTLAQPLRARSTGSPQLVYFSFVTLTTVGYGDVTALHPIGRALALSEALFGQLYPAILIGRLVSLESSGGKGD